MFTGIIEEKGNVKSIARGRDSAVITVAASHILKDVYLGDSIAVNGVCLTVTSYSDSSFTADIMHETLERSSLSSLKPGSRVNLERAMKADGRFGGHIVSGHIDGTGTISSIQHDDNAVWYTISAPPRIMRYIIEKGSVAIDGISLTVARVTDSSFSVSVIPHTASVTILGDKKTGDTVNIENDCIGKYVEKLMMSGSAAEDESSPITEEFLAKYGFR